MVCCNLIFCHASKDVAMVAAIMVLGMFYGTGVLRQLSLLAFEF